MRTPKLWRLHFREQPDTQYGNKNMNAENIKNHVKNASDEARRDMAASRWDEVMTDALYADCGAETQDEMATAREIAERAASELTRI